MNDVVVILLWILLQSLGVSASLRTQWMYLRDTWRRVRAASSQSLPLVSSLLGQVTRIQAQVTALEQKQQQRQRETHLATQRDTQEEEKEKEKEKEDYQKVVAALVQQSMSVQGTIAQLQNSFTQVLLAVDYPALEVHFTSHFTSLLHEISNTALPHNASSELHFTSLFCILTH